MKLSKKGGLLMAAAVAFLPMQAHAKSKENVPITQYCQAQQSLGVNEAHKKYTPFKNQFADVSVNSRVHGPITLNRFNCGTLIPQCATGGFQATKGTLSSIHAGLGNYNRGDDPSIKKAIEILGRNATILTPAFARTNQSIQHLQDSKPGHGLDLYKIDGKFDIGQTSEALYRVCASQLKR